MGTLFKKSVPIGCAYYVSLKQKWVQNIRFMDSVWIVRQLYMDSIWIDSIDYPYFFRRVKMEIKEIKVRGINKKYVQEIDRRCVELTEQTGQKWSRNDYLKLLIENDFERPLMDYKKDQFDRLLEKFTDVQLHNTKVLEAYTNEVKNIIEILIAH